MQTLAYKSFVGGCLMSPYICLRKQGDTKPKVKNPRRVSSEIVFFHINGLGRDGFPSRFFLCPSAKKNSALLSHYLLSKNIRTAVKTNSIAKPFLM